MILMNVIKDVSGSDEYLWPYLLEFIINTTFSPGLATISEALCLLIEKSGKKEFSIDYEKNENAPKSQALLLRIVILLYKPNTFKKMGLGLIKLLKMLMPILEEDFKSF